MNPATSLPFGAKKLQSKFMSSRRSSMNRPETDYDLFRRAIVFKDQEAWTELHRVYSKWLESNIRVRQYRVINEDPQLVEEMANEAIYKFWHAFDAAHFLRSRGLAQILVFLDLCITSVILSWFQKRKGKRFVSLDDDTGTWGKGEAIEVPDPNAVDVIELIVKQQVYDCLFDHCKNAEEKYILHGLLVEGKTLGEIFSSAPQRWQNKHPHFDQCWRNYKERKFATGCAELFKDFWNDMP